MQKIINNDAAEWIIYLPLAVTEAVEKVIDISLTAGEERMAQTFTAGTVSLILISDVSISTMISMQSNKADNSSENNIAIRQYLDSRPSTGN